MDLAVIENGDYDRRRVENGNGKNKNKNKMQNTKNNDKNKMKNNIMGTKKNNTNGDNEKTSVLTSATTTATTVGESKEEKVEVKEEIEVKESAEKKNDLFGNEIPPKPEDYVESSNSVVEDLINGNHPTMAPVTSRPTTVVIQPPPPPPTETLPPYPDTEKTITDLAKQELGNFMAGGPKPSDNNAEGGEAETETSSENTETGTDDNFNDNEPSEMDIIVPETEEEEEEIDEEIEEWEEEHGKEKPEQDGDDNVAEEMDIPQTQEEEDTVNEEIEEWEEDNGKPKPTQPTADDDDGGFDTETVTAAPEQPQSEGEETVNPLVVSPSWTPPKIEPKHTLKPRPPTMAPVQQQKHSPENNSQNDFATPNGTDALITNQEACKKEYGTQSASYLLCTNGMSPMAASAAGVGAILLILLCCCWKYCCGRSGKSENGRGEYRQIANTYGDASFDNAFSEDISDDESEDLEDATWGNSNGKTVLEMRDLGRRRGDDDLSLEEMNG